MHTSTYPVGATLCSAVECRAARGSGIRPGPDVGGLGRDNSEDTGHYYPHHRPVHHCDPWGFHLTNPQGTSWLLCVWICTLGIHSCAPKQTLGMPLQCLSISYAQFVSMSHEPPSLLQFMKAYHDQKGRRRPRKGRKGDGVTLSKTEDQGATVVETVGKTRVLKGFAKFDAK